MPTLYWNDTQANNNWDDVLNWFEDDACTIQANDIPWTSDNDYKYWDLTRSSLDGGNAVYINSDIGDGFQISGVCDIGLANDTLQTQNGSIYGGTFTGDGFMNYGSIYGGTFTGDGFINYYSIFGGKFSGAGFADSGAIAGGLFDISCGITTGNNGIKLQVFDFALMEDALFIGGSSWNSSTWYEDYECTIPWTGSVPWTDATTANKYLLRGIAGEGSNISWINIVIDTTIGDFPAEITGECYITYATDSSFTSTLECSGSSIFGGAFSGDYFTNNSGFIYGGMFNGDYFITDNIGIILGGVFSGDYFTSIGGYIYGGTFSGDSFSNGNYIYGGTFSGDGFSNNIGGYIYGGTFSGYYFLNSSGNSNILGGTFSGDYFTSIGGYIYGGTFSGDYFTNNGGYIYGGIFSGDYFTNNGNIYGGFWLESGTLDVAYHDADGNSSSATPIAGYTRITGRFTNPFPWSYESSSNQAGFTTLRIAGQDVLGGGLI